MSHAIETTSGPASGRLRSPGEVRHLAERLRGKQDEHRRQLALLESELARTRQYLELADPVTEALRELGEQLFEQVLGTMQSRLTIALQDVLEQPVEFRATADFKRGSATVEFSIARNGNQEDIRRGQGGSVHNILSVGLRMFALASLDPQRHRPFLVLDEQDCWLRPELVPKLVEMVAAAARELDFQVLMISHHDIGLFREYANKTWQLVPNAEEVVVREFDPHPANPDRAAIRIDP